MGFVRGMVESGLSAAEHTALEKARAAAPQTVRHIDLCVEKISAHAFPLLDKVDARVDSTLAVAADAKARACSRYDAMWEAAQGEVQRTKGGVVAKVQQTTEGVTAKLAPWKQGAAGRLSRSTARVGEQYAQHKATVLLRTAAAVKVWQQTKEQATTVRQLVQDPRALATAIQRTASGTRLEPAAARLVGYAERVLEGAKLQLPRTLEQMLRDGPTERIYRPLRCAAGRATVLVVELPQHAQAQLGVAQARCAATAAQLSQAGATGRVYLKVQLVQGSAAFGQARLRAVSRCHAAQELTQPQVAAALAYVTLATASVSRAVALEPRAQALRSRLTEHARTSGAAAARVHGRVVAFKPTAWQLVVTLCGEAHATRGYVAALPLLPAPVLAFLELAPHVE